MGPGRSVCLIALCLMSLSAGGASGAEDWVSDARALCESHLPRPRRAMLVFPLAEAGSETGKIGWGRGLIAVQAMWKSSFGPQRLLDTYDFTVVDRYSDQQLLGPGRRVTKKKIEAVCAVLDASNYATGTLEVTEEEFLAKLTLRGEHGEEKREHGGPRNELHLLPCRIARDVLEYMEVSLTPDQRQYVSEPPLNSTELFDEVAAGFHGLVGAGTDQLGFWDCVCAACETDWTRYRRFRALGGAGSMEIGRDEWRELSAESGCPALGPACAESAYELADGHCVKPEEAGAVILRAIQEHPYVPEAYGWLAFVLGRAGEPQLAEKVLDRLVAAYNGSHVGLLYRGVSLDEYAWEARGGGWAHEVEPEAWPVFHSRLQKARDDLEQALELEPLCWPARGSLVWVGLGNGLGRGYCEEKFRQALEACPTDQGAYSTMIYPLLPRWGGSTADLLAFGRRCADTELYLAGIPALLAEAHWWVADGRAVGQHTGRAKENAYERYFAQDWVWEEVSPVLEETVRRDPWNCEALCRYLSLAHWHGDTAVTSRLWQLTRREMAGRPWVVRDICEVDPDRYEEIGALVEGGWPELHAAARYGDAAKVRKLLEAGAEPGSLLPGGWTPLHLAVRGGHIDIVQELLAAGADADPHTNTGLTPFYFAVRYKRDRIRDLLAEHGVDADVCGWDDRSLLCCAVFERDAALCWLLLKVGADPDLRSNQGYTPLYDAAYAGWTEGVRLLLENGADPDKPTAKGYTPLYQATANGHAAVVEALLEADAGVGRGCPRGYTALHKAAREGHSHIVQMLLEHGAEVNRTDNEDQWTPLHQPARTGHEQCAEMLLDAGADVNAKTGNGWTPLLLAAEFGHRGVAELLISRGADMASKTQNSATPLHCAAGRGHLETVDALLEAGADPNEREGCKWGNPLQAAVFSGNAQVVAHLAEAGAEADRADAWGRTPLHLAAERGHAEIVKLLLGLGVSTGSTADAGLTSLHMAAARGRVGCVTLLLEAGADVELADDRGDTALHFAARGGHPECARVLLEHGVPLNPRNQSGRTPLGEALENGHQAVAELLRRHGAEQ